MDDARQIRSRQIDYGPRPDPETVPAAGSVAMLLQTKTATTYPTAAGRAYACDVIDASGDETEGSTPTFAAVTGQTVYAVNLGSTVPPSGTRVVGVQCGGRVVFRYDG